MSVTRLSEIVTKSSITAPRVILYGVQGIGKTTECTKLNLPIFVQSEDGLGTIEVPHFPKRESYEDILEDIRTLIKEEHPYKTLVLDSLDTLEKLLFSAIAKESGVESIADIGFGKGYALAQERIRNFLKGLDILRNQKNMTIILIAHSKIVRFESPISDPYDRFALALHDKIAAIIEQWSDAVLFANYNVSVRSKEKKAVGDGSRTIYTAERPAFAAKNRYSLPLQVDFDLKKIIDGILIKEKK